jgi:ferredoxin
MKTASTNTLPKLDEGRCKAIGTCVEACPERAIEMRGFRFLMFNHEHAVLTHPERCTGCGACVEACPVGAWSL